MVQVVLIGGFLGAGKTTTMIRAARWFEQAGRRVIVVTNDQGEALVDAAVARASGVTTGEVTGGCFCCRFDDLVDTTVRLVEAHGADLVLAEAVGSCTDLTATVVRPLREYYGDRFQVAPLTVMVDPIRWPALAAGGNGTCDSLGYLYRKQLEEAEIIGLNKVDLLPHDDAAGLHSELAAAFPSAHVVPVSARTGNGAEQLFALWTGWDDARPSRVATLDIDYDVYAEAEAQLAWLNAAFDLVSSGPEGFAPAMAVELVLTELGRVLHEAGAFVGHIKAQLSTVDGVTSANLVRAGDRPSFRFRQRTPVDRGQLVLNARVVVPPALLEHRVEGAVEAMSRALTVRSDIVQWSAFRPARPQPVHRIGA